MTTKPKALKYRIRRATPVSDDADSVVATDVGKGDPGADPAAATPSATTTNAGIKDDAPKGDSTDIAAEIAAIRREGLTGRQLRMARRLAQKHGLAPTSDFDAVRLLRAKGVDPFQRANMLELVVANEPAGKSNAPALPKTVPAGGGADGGSGGGTNVGPPGDPRAYQAREIRAIQKDIAKRRRRRLALLFARLLVFVMLPTFVAGWYYHNIATPMYATKSEFLIQQAEGAGGTSLGGLFSGTGFATSQDSITVQSYLQSRDAMLRLDADIGFKSHFSQASIDDLQRLDPGATNEEAYKVYQKRVTLGYDPTEGIIKMEVVAADPAVSAAFSRALLEYAEEQVDNLTQRLRGDQMQGANESFEVAELKMVEAQARVLELQQRLGVLDPTSESSALLGQITQFETQLRQKRLELQQLLDNRRPNRARVAGVEGDIGRLEALVAELRSQMTDATESRDSLASMSGQLRIAEIDLQTRTAMMQQSLQQLETARIEANRQVRYLSVGVSPVPPDEATYPKAFSNTVLAFLIFSGIYLMASLTASILREQVSG